MWQSWIVDKELYEEISKREKEMLWRPGYRDIKPGKLVFVLDEKSKLQVTVYRVIHTRIDSLTEEELKAIGYESVEKFVYVMKRFYNDIDENSHITMVFFRNVTGLRL